MKNKKVMARVEKPMSERLNPGQTMTSRGDNSGPGPQNLKVARSTGVYNDVATKNSYRKK